MLEARDLAVTPPGASGPSVSGVSLRLGAGEWLALAGENGGGKTSLLLALAGLWPISAGSLTLDGRPLGPGSRASDPSGLAVVLQDPSSQLLQPTVGEELAFTARNLGLTEREIARDVERWRVRLGLDSDPALEPATLSAGRQQLVLLTAALIARPRLLLADEPTAHLDATARSRVRAAIAEEVARGLAVVWATQDEDELGAASRTIEVGRARGRTGDVGVDSEPVVPGAVTDGDAGARSVECSAPRLVLDLEPENSGSGPRLRITSPRRLGIGASGVTALVGPNGSGKSVVLAAAAGLIAVPQVRVTSACSPERPPILALQYPELQVFEEVVADEIVFAAVARGVERAAALASASGHLRELGLDPGRILERRTWTLSTGEKRLVEVVGALIAPASLVMLDEPTAGLDLERRSGLARLVSRRAERDPVLVASQDAGWVGLTGARRFSLGA